MINTYFLYQTVKLRTVLTLDILRIEFLNILDFVIGIQLSYLKVQLLCGDLKKIENK